MIQRCMYKKQTNALYGQFISLCCCCYMFRRMYVIFRELFCSLLSYIKKNYVVLVVYAEKVSVGQSH
jgi:hypothetical protein